MPSLDDYTTNEDNNKQLARTDYRGVHMVCKTRASALRASSQNGSYGGADRRSLSDVRERYDGENDGGRRGGACASDRAGDGRMARGGGAQRSARECVTLGV